MFDRSNCDRKSQLSGILTEPLNSREGYLSCNQTYKQPNRQTQITTLYIEIYITLISRWTKPVGSVKQAQDQAGYCKKSERAIVLRRDYAKKIDPCRMLVWLGRRIVQNIVIGSSQYTLLFGRPVQTGQVLFEFKFTTAQSDFGSQCYKVYEKKFAFY